MTKSEKTRLPRYKKAKTPTPMRLTEMSRPISTAESIRELPRKLTRNRREVENEIKKRMSNTKIFNNLKLLKK